MIMYSLGVSGETECSRASAGLWKRRRQSGPWMRWRRGRILRGRFGGDDDVEDADESAEEDEDDIER